MDGGLMEGRKLRLRGARPLRTAKKRKRAASRLASVGLLLVTAVAYVALTRDPISAPEGAALEAATLESPQASSKGQGLSQPLDGARRHERQQQLSAARWSSGSTRRDVGPREVPGSEPHDARGSARPLEEGQVQVVTDREVFRRLGLTDMKVTVRDPKDPSRTWVVEPFGKDFVDPKAEASPRGSEASR